MLQERFVGLIVAVALGGAASNLGAAPRAGNAISEGEGPARAAPKAAGKAGPPLAAPVLADFKKQLSGDDPQAAIAAARKLGESGASNAATPLVELLAMGTTPATALEALGALGKLRSPKSIQVLTLYAGNRNDPVRKAAVQALGALSDARVAGVLIERLGDNAPEIRAAAAEALAARKEERAATRLFKLVAKNDAGAAGPLGVLIAPNDVPKLAELRGQIDDAVLATALGEFLKRPGVADRLRVDVVRTLGRIPGPGATTALVEYIASIPDKDARPSKDEAQKTIDSRGNR